MLRDARNGGDMSSVFEVFWRFLLLGFTSFGGPAAHIGYFRRVFVETHRWLDDDRFASLIALTQFLPGPGSSQLGFGIGLHRAGLPGAIAAFVGFTFPSFVLMVAMAVVAQSFLGNSWADGAIHGLKLLAVVVVADATLGMYQSFCQSRTGALLMTLAAAVLILFGGLLVQLAVLALAALAGVMFLAPSAGAETALSRPRLLPIAVFVSLFGATLVYPSMPGDFFVAGGLVFGGGHVVLPLLQELVAAQLGESQFLTGYALAQAVPGPMFTIASYLGAALWPAAPLAGAAMATLAIFLPGFLLMLGFQESWLRMAGAGPLAGAAAGINAAVVGLLVAALYDPVIVSSIETDRDVALVVVGFVALRVLRVNVAVLVVVMAAAGMLLSAL